MWCSDGRKRRDGFLWIFRLGDPASESRSIICFLQMKNPYLVNSKHHILYCPCLMSTEQSLEHRAHRTRHCTRKIWILKHFRRWAQILISASGHGRWKLVGHIATMWWNRNSRDWQALKNLRTRRLQSGWKCQAAVSLGDIWRTQKRDRWRISFFLLWSIYFLIVIQK